MTPDAKNALESLPSKTTEEKPGAQWQASQVAEAVKIVEDVRDQCALMAEGEGDDPQDYMDIAMYAMRQLDEALAMFKEGTK